MDVLPPSPPVPRTTDPSWCRGEYPPRLGSGPLYQVVRPPDCAFPLAAWRPPDRRHGVGLWINVNPPQTSAIGNGLSGVSFGMSEALVCMRAANARNRELAMPRLI